MKRRKLFIVTILGTIVVLLLIWGIRALVRQPEENSVTVRRGTIQASVEALGRVQPKRQMAVAPGASGTVLRILVQEGQKVEKDQLLMELDDIGYVEDVERAERNLDLRLQQLEEALEAPSASEIAQARARLLSATAWRQDAQEDYNKLADQPDAESSDEALELERAKLEYELADTSFQQVMEGASSLQIGQLRASVQDAEATLAEVRKQLQATSVRAPMTGTIMKVEVQEGGSVSRNNAAMRIANLDALQINADIDELDVPFVSEGQAVEIRLDAFPAQLLEGKIVHLAPGVDETRSTATYPAIVEFDRQELAIRPGMGANLRIITQSAEDVLLVPRRAIRSVGRYQVAYVRVGQQTLEVIVTTGLSNDEQVQVLSGLEEGQNVLLN
jgi:HlyD family secretion protein